MPEGKTPLILPAYDGKQSVDGSLRWGGGRRYRDFNGAVIVYGLARQTKRRKRLVAGGEDDAKPCLAAHHVLIGFGDTLQRKDFIH